MTNHPNCPICHNPGSFAPGLDPIPIDCRICGKYFITPDLAAELANLDRDPMPYLSAATRQADAAGNPILLTQENYEGHIEAHRYTSVSSKARKLLELLARESRFFGQNVRFHRESDYPLIDAISVDEAVQLSEYLHGEKLVHSKSRSEWALTMNGWEEVEPLTSGGVPGHCFVAMAFHPSVEAAYTDGIRAAIENDCGFTAVRMLELHHNDKICDRIIVELRRAQFVVADFTFQRAGVYFEAGFAAALGRPVIWTCKACHFHRLHFDTRQYNHIKWEDPGDLRNQLAARIRGTIPGARL